MIEITRFFLAALVAQTHLWPLGASWPGTVAVFAFYTLSGYLMTRVLNTRYGFTWRGTMAFSLNRVLRLWPAYLVILFGAIVADQLLPLSNFFPLIRTPKTAAEIVTNLVVVGQVTFDFVQWLPLAKPLVTSWSLSIEVCCYLLLAFFFARSPGRLLSFGLLGILAIAASTASCAMSADAAAYGPYCFQSRYGVIQAGFVPFALGGLYYFYENLISDYVCKHSLVLVAVLGMATVSMFAGAWLSATVAPFLGIPFTYILLAVARNYRPTKVQDFFGRASYHLFIGHMPIAAIVVIGFHAPPNTVFTYLIAVLGALLLSAVLVPLEWRLNELRSRVSSSARSSKLSGIEASLPVAQAADDKHVLRPTFDVHLN